MGVSRRRIDSESDSKDAIFTTEDSKNNENIPRTHLPDDRPMKAVLGGTFIHQWLLVPAYIKERGLVRSHIDSFNHFINVELKQLLQANDRVICEADPNWFLKYLDIRVESPSISEDAGLGMPAHSLTPQMCRLRDLTYSAPIMVDVEHVRGKERVRVNNVEIGRMPIMLRSDRCILSKCTEEDMRIVDECPNDPGGYFVVRGVEKVVLIHEQLSKNRMMASKNTKDELQCEVMSSTLARKSKFYVVAKKTRYYARHNLFIEDVPIIIVFKALGVENEQEITQLISTEPQHMSRLLNSFEECTRHKVQTRKQAIAYISAKIKTFEDSGRSRQHTAPVAPAGNDDDSELDDWYDQCEIFDEKEEDVADQLNEIFVAHIPQDANGGNVVNKRKAVYIAFMLKRLIRVELGEAKEDDCDFYGNKRMELAGSLLSLLFDDLLKRFNDELRKIAQKSIPKVKTQPFNILNHFQKSFITNGLNTCLSSGNWSIKRFRMERAGVTQVLSRLSYISALGMMTRVNPTVEKSRKVSGPRSLQPSQWGMLCPCDTPEGESCGLVKNLALLAHVTVDEPDDQLIELALSLGVVDVNNLAGSELHQPSHYIVYVNGIILGATSDPRILVESIRELRRTGILNPFVSVSTNNFERVVLIATDGGRLCRPYLVVNRSSGKLVANQEAFNMLACNELSFSDFVTRGYIEFLDVNEENNSDICVYPNQARLGATTHCEIEPFALLGICSALVPYPNHNQSPRNTYQCAMGKQAMGTIAFNQRLRIDTLMYLLCYPQRPMVQSKTLELVGFTQMPAGQNACVAVMSYSGYDIEDAIVINKASLDRGFGRCVVYKNQKVVLKGYQGGQNDRLMGPTIDSESRRPISKHKQLDLDGICYTGSKLTTKQVMLNKHTPVITDCETGLARAMPTEQKYKESSTCHRGPPAYAEKIMISQNEEQQTLVKVLLRQVRRPELGDKFSSRHGQKGVVGLVIRQEDMPFAESGVVPDLIMNPHGFPSRMTVGKLMELLAGKTGTYDGRIRDGSAFGGDDIEIIAKTLESCGHHYMGKETLTSGITGNQLQAYIYFGPIYYQKLKHMVLDKMHARAKGPRATLTRQPTEGRAREGGLRLGEMERDCLIAYGASLLVQERLMVSSDSFEVEVCDVCGLLAAAGWCQKCRSSQHICTILMPYACKLLFQELQSMSIFPKLTLSKRTDEGPFIEKVKKSKKR